MQGLAQARLEQPEGAHAEVLDRLQHAAKQIDQRGPDDLGDLEPHVGERVDPRQCLDHGADIAGERADYQALDLAVEIEHGNERAAHEAIEHARDRFADVDTGQDFAGHALTGETLAQMVLPAFHL